MNQKAQREEIQFPPLLNLQEDRPRIASDFKSVEHINAPYINGMLMPLWNEEYQYQNKPVYDYNNNRYEIIDGYLTKNGENIFSVQNNHFEKQDVTEQYNKYLSFDFDDEGNLAKMEWDTGTNSVSLTYDDVTITQQNIFINGIILTSRVRCINNTAIGVLVYEINKVVYFLYMNTSENRKQTVIVEWCTTTPKTNTANNFSVNTITIDNPSPMINIANPLQDVWAVSMVSNYGEVLFTQKEGYFTFVDNDGTYIYGDDWVASNGSSTETIQNYQYTNFNFSYQNNSTQEYIRIYQRDGVWYYVETPTTTVSNTESIYFTPQIVANTFITYDDVQYQVYQVSQWTNRIVLQSFADDLHSNTTTLEVVLNIPNTVLGPEEYDDNAVSFDYTYTDWLSWNIKPVGFRIIYDSDTYIIDNYVSQYTITEELSPTTVTASYITFPNVFLDNGNMYSWYTIPTANYTSNSQPITFPQNSMIVESASLNTISGNNYTFDVIESHIVNSTTKYGRSNSVIVYQNFWDSSLKMASDNVRAPYNIYVAKQTQTNGSWSSTIKLTEYSNSNCSDMLYYCGTLPRNDFQFFPNATASSIDVAWFNAGGFRTQLKGNWNLLYYVDSNGTVGIQGISYSENTNKMGTLVSPIGSISDVGYVCASNNFIVYRDNHNKYWKISIEEGVKLSSVFDNRYIIVNTTSYWNMWDNENNMKFHYATDYNNRTKFGFLRTEYRNNIWNNYFTVPDARKWATAINSNYNILPRLPVTSIMPSTLQLSLIIKDNIVSYLHTYYSESDESREVQPIDVYLQGTSSNDTSAKYIASIKSFAGNNQIYRDGNIVDTVYSDSSSIIFIADIFSTFINGAGNKDFIVENDAKYPLIYNSQNKPVFLYSIVSGIDVEGIKWFFVIQGQYYAVIGEKLYAMIYNNGYISQSDAIVDIRDMKYVGNTPAIAFFVNPYTKQMYSFTGDANLQQIFDCSKFNFELVNDEITHWYDESTQSIYIKTNKGLLVFGPQNTYCLEEFTDTLDIEFMSGDIHIIGNSKVNTLRYYHDIEEYNDLPIKMETSFWGLGSNESITIDRWNVTLYDPEHREQDVEFMVRSITDVSTQSEIKKLHINKNDWDEWSHSVLLSYSPKLIKGQGIRLSINTHSAIQKIVPHVMDNHTSTTTRGKFEV